MSRKHIGVIRGGPSSEHDVSLKSGGTIMKNLNEDLYDIHDIFISPNGLWHIGGVVRTPNDIISHIDMAFLALHGYYGEDGKIQHILELHDIPFNGSGSFSSALAMNKSLSKEFFKREGIKTPQYKVINKEDNMEESDLVILFRTFPLPFVVKPVNSGSSVGVTLVKDFQSFEKALEYALSFGDNVIIEEYIKGKEATVGVIDSYRGQDIYALPAIEIRPPKDFFDFEAKYSDNGNGAEEIVPGNFTETEKMELENIAKRVHKSLGLRHYSRSDFIVSPTRGIFVLETNTLPGMTETSLFPKALLAVGATLPHFLYHIIELAMGDK